MTSLKPNSGKNLEIRIKEGTYLRYPVKTHIVSSEDEIIEVLKKYAQEHLEKNDMLVISERFIAVIQGRSFLIEDIKPTFWANFLSKFVSRHPGGIGLKSPWTMQLAIQEAGLPRIFFAGLVSAITRPFGLKGLFYHLVGNDINAIDGPCDYTLPPGNKSAKLGPKDPTGVAKKISKELNVKVAIVDANDYGVRVMGVSEGVDKKLVQEVFKDNPLGQSNEQTPMAIVRVKS
ncbi:MAG TPA: coenzyme F420-0:L-glutamate ligase [Candidatus Nitrosocosmicus sp.]|nr:coenzyme F420-0:L-glutamate ligase [Candidatus Nitrosocosmicus sp.]